MSNQMFKKYLLKNNFWRKKSGDEDWFIKHDPIYGGIYARLLQKGVEIKYNHQRLVFTNFTDLSDFLNRLYVGAGLNNSTEFNRLLKRNLTSKMLRTELSI
ncbi:MAG: hypothetical protein ACTSRZ_10710 [Promethearchaeota archaeon]